MNPVELFFHHGAYTLTRIADASDRFRDFMPYVASVNDAGVVAFQATLRVGGSGAYTAEGGVISAVIDPLTDALSEVISHADINQEGSTSFYGTLRTGGRGVFAVRNGVVITIAETGGPLGPTMNDDGTVAFRAEPQSGVSAILTGSGGPVTAIADTRGPLSAFHGLPVINNGGAVVFRADRKAGGDGIYLGDGGPLVAIAETEEFFSELGDFPVMNDAGIVAFCARLSSGGSGIFAVSNGHVAPVMDTRGPFESYRGVLLNNAGRIVFYATPRGGELGVFTGPDPRTDFLIGLGAPLFGSTVVDFALNPVSMNDVGQVAIRVKLADETQIILRADPV
jgi:hypothetical protein